ncbi:coronin-like protein [[Candida] jaroonii]|uniref:Coronin-like protein n=1 Tax=[Candida] jaroonii TaxID=467808 RepID=A0ACA9Y803_9ASCO|nr:coronin-like protein [[Candida] jaroonii]
MSGKFVRASKYRHVFGQASKKELCYENLKVTKNAWDSDIIQTNGKYISLNWDSSGGGAFAIIPVGEVGKAPDTVSLFRGHKGPVLDTSFNPFNDQQIVSCSDDGKILVWEIPQDYSFHKYIDENENIKDITEPIKVLSGHTRKVGKVQFHPCAENVLASCSLDYSVKIWNLETGKDEITLQHKDLVTSFAFNYNGSLMVTASRDKKLRIWDVRSGKIISEGPGHTGAKPARVAWLGNTDRVVTTGFSRLSDRQVGVWDVNDINKGPIDGFLVIDQSSGVLIPIYDDATSILYLAGKGDGNIRYYEYENDYLHDLSQYPSTDPQRGFCASPKRAVNVKENEILKCYKTVNDHSIEPLSFIVPRRSELFQNDIFPDCPSNKPALTADEWFGGKKCNGPLLMSMESIYEGTEPEITESKPGIKVGEAKAAKEAEKAKEVEKPVEKVVEKPVEKDEPVQEPKSVDDSLKSSSEVNKLLDKVTVSSDVEEEVESGVKDDEWEEVKKPVEAPVVIEKEEVPKVTKEAKVEPKVEPKVEAKSEPKVEPKVEPKEEPKISKPVESAPSEVTTEAKSEAKPTLKSTIDRLASIVDKLESQVSKLTAAGLEKDEKLSQLEKKLDELLKK